MKRIREIAEALRSADRGQALAELAVITPLLLLLVIGLIEVGRYAQLSIVVANAARAGAQYGTQSVAAALDGAGMQNAATADAQNDPNITATATYFCSCANGATSTCQAGDCATSHRLIYVQVDVTGRFTSMIHWYAFQPALTIPSRSVMRVVQ